MHVIIEGSLHLHGCHDIYFKAVYSAEDMHEKIKDRKGTLVDETYGENLRPLLENHNAKRVNLESRLKQVAWPEYNLGHVRDGKD